MKEKSESEVLFIVASYCSTAERCIDEVKKKMEKYHLDESAMERIIEKLVKENYINEERFTHSFVNDKLRFNKWGKIKIKYELRLKKIPSSIYQKALDNIDDQLYKETLTDLLIKKSGSVKGKNKYDIYQKLMRYAAAKGFEPDLISQSVSTIINYTADE